jgi:SAM-dependent methyltransferase
MREEKRIVKDFYDGFGWERNTDGTYRDTVAFVDVRPVLREYYHKVYLRVKSFVAPQGEYFLDAGSGAIPHPEYMEYSAGYRRRVCVDLSLKALSEARAKLGGRGLYVMADLTRLPFRERIFDATVCAHVLYHIPEDEQASAVQELYRTLKPDASCVIIYGWRTSLATQLASLAGRRAVLARLRRLIARIPGTRFLWGRFRRPAAQDASREGHGQPERPPLYFHPGDYQWFRQMLPEYWDTDIRCWRFADRAFTTTFVGDNVAGRLLLELLFKAETRFPHAMARVGRYPMIIIRKGDHDELS